jgi:hypothetical protein
MSVSAMPRPVPTSALWKKIGSAKLEIRKRLKTLPGLMRPSGM